MKSNIPYSQAVHYSSLMNNQLSTSVFGSVCDISAEKKISSCATELSEIGVFSSSSKTMKFSEMRHKSRDYFAEMCRFVASYIRLMRKLGNICPGFLGMMRGYLSRFSGNDEGMGG